MPKEKVGKIPDFDGEDSQEQKVTEENKLPAEGNQEVKQTEGDKPSEEKATPAKDASIAQKPADQKEEVSDDTDKAAVQGLETQRDKLLIDIQQLRGTRRDLRQKQEEKPEETEKVVEDPIKDIHPKDREIIKKVIEAEGYVKKDEATALIYKDVEQQQLNDWLDAHPEFKTENDPTNRNWNILMQEYNLYRKPEDSSQTKEFLERARKAIPSVTPVGEQGTKKTQTQQKKMETAGMGTGGVQNSSPSGLSVPPGMNESEAREHYSRGGYTDEEIDEMLKTK